MMSELSKQEYQILYYFYGFNQSLTKNELLDKVPELNSSTTAMVLKKLLDNGYLEIEKITYSRTVLARVYK
ncbi:transcriptional regulator, BlaI/MecI/CopY family protein, partial [Listeria monocytogenes]|nr:transcriptional regulator, BlaI/MecI/CopY family protein [Listeria monocytogenes]